MHVFTTRAYKLFMQGDHFDMGHIRLDKISVKIFNIYILSTVLRNNLKAFFMLCKCGPITFSLPPTNRFFVWRNLFSFLIRGGGSWGKPEGRLQPNYPCRILLHILYSFESPRCKLETMM